MGVDKPERTTPLFIDMEIASELLGRSHGEFLELSKIEKKKLRMYWRVKWQKEEQAVKDSRMEMPVKG